MDDLDKSLCADVLKDLIPDAPWNTPEMERTPERWAKMMIELTDPAPAEFDFTVFDNVEEVDQMVIVGPISFVTLCAHHLIPFIGDCHIAYLPGTKLAGLSKFKRLVDFWCKGVWNQETLTHHIATSLEDYLVDPLGVAVAMTAEHLCMTIRGAQSTGTKTTTSCMRGAFADHDRQARSEFLTFIRPS